VGVARRPRLCARWARGRYCRSGDASLQPSIIVGAQQAVDFPDRIRAESDLGLARSGLGAHFEASLSRDFVKDVKLDGVRLRPNGCRSQRRINVSYLATVGKLAGIFEGVNRTQRCTCLPFSLSLLSLWE
jgi:hypothetical protein